MDVKTRIANDDLTLNDYSVIASEPPIIVKYSVTVPFDYTFPYGESKTHSQDVGIIILMSCCASLVLVMIPCFLVFTGGSGNE